MPGLQPRPNGFQFIEYRSHARILEGRSRRSRHRAAKV
jgi:hypothetical protein